MKRKIYTSIDEALENKEKVQFLDLSKQNLNALPDEVSELKNLLSLNLQKNEIEVLPGTLSQLTHLKVLDLRHNRIKRFPLVIFELENLRKLALSHNQLMTIPGLIHRLTLLESLYISHNNIVRLPYLFSDLQSLRTLSMSNNHYIDDFSYIEYLKLNNLDVSNNRIPHFRIDEYRTLLTVREKAIYGRQKPGMVYTLEELEETDVEDIYGIHFEDQNLDHFPEKITQCMNLRYLNLKDQKMAVKQMPLSVYSLTDLEFLNLQNTELEEIPEDIGNLHYLQHLELGDNQISRLPDAITGLKYLNYLGLRLNRIAELPESIGNLEQLTAIMLRGNGLKELPESMGRLKNLFYLYASDNQIKKIPSNIARWKDIAEVDFTNNPLSLKDKIRLRFLFKAPMDEFVFNAFRVRGAEAKIFTSIEEALSNPAMVTNLALRNQELTEFPKEILDLPNLFNLNLDNNAITKIPEEISKLTKLRILSLNFNQIKNIPENIRDLSSLREFSINHNQIEGFPRVVLELTKLRRLGLAGSQLDNIPEEIERLEYLETLDISDSHITDLPEGFSKLKNLRVLEAGYNELQSFPESIPALKKLRYLYLRACGIKTIPRSISRMQQLSELFIGANSLKDLPDVIQNMPQLRTVDISGNQFSEIPESILRNSGVSGLYADRNPITEIDEKIAEGLFLKELNLYGCSIAAISEKISVCKNLNYLSLGETKIESLPSGIAYLPQLKDLFLQGTSLSAETLPKEIITESVIERIHANGIPLGDAYFESMASDFSSLKELSLAKTNITKIPDFIWNTASLEYIRLEDNAIEQIDLNKIDTIAGKWKMIDISRNNLPDETIREFEERIKEKFPDLEFVNLPPFDFDSHDSYESYSTDSEFVSTDTTFLIDEKIARGNSFDGILVKKFDESIFDSIREIPDWQKKVFYFDDLVSEEEMNRIFDELPEIMGVYMQRSETRKLKDLKFLAKLSQLKLLYMTSYALESFDGLEQIDSLEYCALTSIRPEDEDYDNPVYYDISGLKNHHNLKSVYFYGTKITGEEALAGKNLEYANFYMSEIKSLEFVREMTNMEYLDVYACKQIPDISPIADLTKLTYLNLYMLEVEDFSALEKLAELEEIWLHFTKIKNTNSMRDMSRMKFLRMTWCPELSDISGIADMKNLELLSIEESQVQDLSVLENLTSLRDLNLSEIKATDFSSVKNCRELRDLDISENQVDDFSFLAELKNLTHLYLQKTNFNDLNLLSGMTQMKYLNISQTSISDIAPLSSLKKIEQLYLEECRVSDLTVLSNFQDLNYLMLNENEYKELPAGLGAVKDSSYLTISLARNRLQKEHFETLRASLPECDIYGEDDQLSEEESSEEIGSSASSDGSMSQAEIDAILNGATGQASTESNDEPASHHIYDINKMYRKEGDGNDYFDYVKEGFEYEYIGEGRSIFFLYKINDVLIESLPGIISDEGVADLIWFAFSEKVTYDEIDELVSKVPQIRNLFFSKDKGFYSPERIDFISKMRNLKRLDLSNQKIANLNSLKSISTLEEFSYQLYDPKEKRSEEEIAQEETFDLSLLSGHKNLKYLYLWGRPVINADSLSALNPEHLNMTACGLENIKFIENYTNLYHLDLDSNAKIDNIIPIKKLASLEYLDLTGVKIKDPSVLQNLASMSWLKLQDTGIKNIDFVKKMTNLFNLNISGNQAIKNTKPLQYLTALHVLSADCIQGTDFSFLQSTNELSYLSLANTKFTGEDIEYLKGKENLTHLNLSYTNLASINSLPILNSLETLYLSGNLLKNIEVLLSFKSLTNLYLDDYPGEKLPKGMNALMQRNEEGFYGYSISMKNNNLPEALQNLKEKYKDSPSYIGIGEAASETLNQGEVNALLGGFSDTSGDEPEDDALPDDEQSADSSGGVEILSQNEIDGLLDGVTSGEKENEDTEGDSHLDEKPRESESGLPAMQSAMRDAAFSIEDDDEDSEGDSHLDEKETDDRLTIGESYDPFTLTEDDEEESYIIEEDSPAENKAASSEPKSLSQDEIDKLLGG